MKKNFKLFSLILALAMVIGCMTGLLTACTPEDTPPGHTHTFSTTEWAKDASGHWRPATCGHTTERGSFATHVYGPDGTCTVCGWENAGTGLTHTCETKCPTCGKCLNSECTEADCAEKCGDTKEKTQDFECEDPHTTLIPGTDGVAAGSLNRNVHEAGSDCTYVGGFNANGGSAIEAKIVSNKDATVTILARVCKRGGAVVFTSVVGLWVNDDIMERDTIVPPFNSAKGEAEWTTFTFCNLGCIELKKGVNTIKFQCLDPDANKGFNFDKMQFKTDDDVELSWYEEPEDTHVCETKCAVCGKCLNPDCTKNACKEKCDGEDRTEYRFDGTADQVELAAGESGMPSKEQNGDNAVGNLNINKGAKVIFKINAEDEGVATLFVNVCKGQTENKFADGMSTTVNDALLETPTVLPACGVGDTLWHSYIEICLGCIHLNKGENTIVFEVISETAFSPNLATLVLKSEVPVSWTDGGKVAQDYRFAGTADEVELAAGSRGMPSKEQNGDNAVGNFNANVNAQIIFYIRAEEACTAKLSVNVCKRGAPLTFTNSVSVRVNGTEFKSTAVVPAYDPDTEEDWHYYVTVELGEIRLNKGDNSIVFTALLPGATDGFNFNSMTLNASETLTWGEKISIEPEIKGPDYRFEAEDPHTALKEGTGIDGKTPTMPAKGNEEGVGRVGNLNANAGSGITFYVHASAAGKATLSVSVGKRGKELTFTQSMKITVNGQDVTSEAKIPACGADPDFNTYVTVEIGEIDLNEGDNIIAFEMISGDAGEGFNFDAIILHTETATLTWGSAPAAAAALAPFTKKLF